MFAINHLNISNNQQIFNSSSELTPEEITIKILSQLPVKNLGMARLVSAVWRTFIDTHFAEVSTRQFLFILHKYAIYHRSNEKVDILFRFAVKKLVTSDFDKALENYDCLEKSVNINWDCSLVKDTIEDLLKNADSKEKIVKLFDLFLKRKGKIESRSFIETIEPIIKRYFSIHASLKKEKPEVIEDNFKEALSYQKTFNDYFSSEVYLLMGLYLVDTYPELVKNPQFEGFAPQKEICFSDLTLIRIVKQFPFSIVLNYLLIVKYFTKNREEITDFFQLITTREEAIAFLDIGGRNVLKFVKDKEFNKHLNFLDLLNRLTY